MKSNTLTCAFHTYLLFWETHEQCAVEMKDAEQADRERTSSALVAGQTMFKDTWKPMKVIDGCRKTASSSTARSSGLTTDNNQRNNVVLRTYSPISVTWEISLTGFRNDVKKAKQRQDLNATTDF